MLVFASKTTSKKEKLRTIPIAEKMKNLQKKRNDTHAQGTPRNTIEATAQRFQKHCEQS